MHTHLWSLLAGILILTGCESTSRQIGQNAVPAANYAEELAAQPQEVDAAEIVYHLQPGDVVDVKFYHHPELNEQLIIGPDNKVAMQVIGELNVNGMSTGKLSDALTTRYAATLRNPKATVMLRKYAQPRIYVAGEVAQPGAQPFEGARLTALQAIVQSGGFRKGAERGNVVVLRNSGTGKPVFIKLDLQGHLEQTVQADILLRPYDVVYVPQKRIAEVAEFFDEYFNKIVPIYRNMGFNFTYDIRNRVQVQQVAP